METPTSQIPAGYVADQQKTITSYSIHANAMAV